VEGYLQMCLELGQPPEKPASGKFNVRIDPNLHREAQERAAALGVSLNDVVANALQDYIKSPLNY
jgi:predicted HicB family RNase H-like nuclease